MKICRYVMRDPTSTPSLPRYGLIESENVIEISGPPWGSWSRSSRSVRLAEVRLLCPVEPSKIVCIGRNYTAHATELEHEGELALVLGRRCSHLRDTDDALSFVLGYTCLNDVTARDLQKSDVQFTRAKGFDTFCAVGPHIETGLDPSNLVVETHMNGVRRQSGSTSLMIYPPAFLVRWISRMMTLVPGDVIATGTPAGVGPLLAGDTVEVSIAGVGVLRNPVHPLQA